LKKLTLLSILVIMRLFFPAAMPLLKVNYNTFVPVPAYAPPDGKKPR
jgi:hypothetical protein